MKVEMAVEVVVTAKAVLRNDKLALDVSVAAPYGQRTASVSTEITDPNSIAAVRDALSAAIAPAVAKLIPRAQIAALDAARIAGHKGEEI